jgi:hypothetical protein
MPAQSSHASRSNGRGAVAAQPSHGRPAAGPPHSKPRSSRAAHPRAQVHLQGGVPLLRLVQLPPQRRELLLLLRQLAAGALLLLAAGGHVLAVQPLRLRQLAAQLRGLLQRGLQLLLRAPVRALLRAELLLQRGQQRAVLLGPRLQLLPQSACLQAHRQAGAGRCSRWGRQGSRQVRPSQLRQVPPGSAGRAGTPTCCCSVASCCCSSSSSRWVDASCCSTWCPSACPCSRRCWAADSSPISPVSSCSLACVGGGWGRVGDCRQGSCAIRAAFWGGACGRVRADCSSCAQPADQQHAGLGGRSTLR